MFSIFTNPIYCRLLFFHGMFILVALCCLTYRYRSAKGNISRKRDDGSGMMGALCLTVVASLLIGMLPIPWGTGADRELYASQFLWSDLNEIDKDKVFGLYVYYISRFLDVESCFILTALIYCINHYFFAIKVARENVYILLLMFFSGFLFYTYGVNTLRAGFAASFLLLSIAYYQDKWKFYVFMAIAVGCHFSMAIPAIAIVAAKYFDRTSLYMKIWMLSIVLSAVMGAYFEAILADLVVDERAAQYLNKAALDTHYKVGFRLDFILYSCAPIIVAYYYKVKKGFNDQFYSLLVNTYILANSFWILVIRANFSDRFAYLSWFIYPIVLIYPLLKQRMVVNQTKTITTIVFLHELFTYIMFLR